MEMYTKNIYNYLNFNLDFFFCEKTLTIDSIEAKKA